MALQWSVQVLKHLVLIPKQLEQRETEQQLWALAEHYTPRARVADYTQAIMDLGATVCRSRNPECARCPLASNCAACREGRPERYPVRTGRKTLPVRKTVMLMIHDGRDHILLAQRPPTGVWGGLWSFPECPTADNAASRCREQFGITIRAGKPWPELRHSFSHYQLLITPVPARLTGTSRDVMENVPAVWYNPKQPDVRGLSAPVKQLLQMLRKAT